MTSKLCQGNGLLCLALKNKILLTPEVNISMTSDLCHKTMVYFFKLKLVILRAKTTEKSIPFLWQASFVKEMVYFVWPFSLKKETLMPSEVDISMTSDVCHGNVLLLPAQLVILQAKTQKKSTISMTSKLCQGNGRLGPTSFKDKMKLCCHQK